MDLVTAVTCFQRQVRQGIWSLSCCLYIDISKSLISSFTWWWSYSGDEKSSWGDNNIFLQLNQRTFGIKLAWLHWGAPTPSRLRIFLKGQVRLPKRMNFRKTSKGGGGGHSLGGLERSPPSPHPPTVGLILKKALPLRILQKIVSKTAFGWRPFPFVFQASSKNICQYLRSG